MRTLLTQIIGLIIISQVIDFVQPYYLPVEPQPQIIWEVPTEDVIVKRLQESPAGRFMLRMWPSTPPSRPSTKRYLPYHPVARFRGMNSPVTPSRFSPSRERTYRNHPTTQ